LINIQILRSASQKMMELAGSLIAAGICIDWQGSCYSSNLVWLWCVRTSAVIALTNVVVFCYRTRLKTAVVLILLMYHRTPSATMSAEPLTYYIDCTYLCHQCHFFSCCTLSCVIPVMPSCAQGRALNILLTRTGCDAICCSYVLADSLICSSP
jgi:hypothetical protein